MFAFIGAILVILGILGLLHIIATGTVIAILLIVFGLACLAYSQGLFARR